MSLWHVCEMRLQVSVLLFLLPQGLLLGSSIGEGAPTSKSGWTVLVTWLDTTGLLTRPA